MTATSSVTTAVSSTNTASAMAGNGAACRTSQPADSSAARIAAALGKRCSALTASAPDAKATARDQIAQAIAAKGFGKREVLIRVNALDSPWWIDDVTMAGKARPDGILVPKISTVADLNAIANRLSDINADMSIRVWAMIETARAVLDAEELGRQHRAHRPRIDPAVRMAADVLVDGAVIHARATTYAAQHRLHFRAEELASPAVDQDHVVAARGHEPLAQRGVRHPAVQQKDVVDRPGMQAVHAFAERADTRQHDAIGSREKQPAGRHVVSVCHNLSCHLLGAKSIVEHLTRRLGIEVG